MNELRLPQAWDWLGVTGQQTRPAGRNDLSLLEVRGEDEALMLNGPWEQNT